MSLSAIALVTVEDAKAYLELKDSQDDSILETLIDSVSALFNNETNRTLKETTFTDLYLDGSGIITLDLPDWPVVSITEIEEDEVALTEDTDYYLYADEGYLAKIGAVWTDNIHGIKITYKAGYSATTLPSDIKLATLKQVGLEHSRFKSKNWGESGRTFPDGSITIVTDNLLPSVRDILSKYRKL